MNQNDNNDQSTHVSSGSSINASTDKQADAFYITGGNVPADALSYVTRDADARLLQHLLHGDFCYILTSRQMGKSSLMTHMVKRLREHHVAPAVLDLSSQGFSLSGEQWYNGLLEQLGRRLKLEDEIDDFCQDHSHLSPLQLWQSALREVVLQTIATPIVIFIDEIDVVRSLTFSTDEFFAAIRACYNARTEDPAFARLSFCLLGVATPADLIANPRLTPFNIGTRIELSDFSREEANGLSHGLGEHGETNRVLLDRIYYWTGGHPYLTQRLCQAVAENDANLTERSVDACAERLFLSSKAQRQDSNLMFVQQRMLPTNEDERVGLLTLYAKVLSGKGVVADSETGAYVSELKLAGIVAAAAGQLKVRNRIYAQVFGKGWIEENMPGAEMRRQQTAYRKGLVRALSMSSAVLLVVVGLAIFGFLQANRANRSVAAAILQRNAAERIAYIANMNLIPPAYEASQMDRVSELLEETQQEKYKPYRGFEWGYWNRLAHLELRTLKGHTDGVYSVAFSSDSQRIVTGSVDLTAKVWDAQTGRELLTLKGHSGYINSAAFSPDGKRIVTGSWDKTARVWDAITGREILTLKGHTDRLKSVRFTPDSQRIITASDDGQAMLWDAHTGQHIRILKSHTDALTPVAFSSDAQRVATGSVNSTAKVWEVQTGQELMTLKGPKNNVISLSFSPDGREIITDCDDNTARVWDVSTGRELLTFKLGMNHLPSLFSPDGKYIAVGYDTTTEKVYDAQTGREIITCDGKTFLRSVAFSPDSTQIIAGSQNNTATVWDVQTGRERMTLHGHTDQVFSVAFSPDSQWIVTGSMDKTAKIWDAWTDRKTLTVDAYGGLIALSPDGQRIVTNGDWGDRNTANVLDAQTGREILTLKGHINPVTSVAYSPDSQRIVTGSGDIYKTSEASAAKVWNAQTGREIWTLTGHSNPIESVAFSPDGQRIATADYYKMVKIWDAHTGRNLQTLDAIAPVAFSPDSRRLFTGSNHNAVKVWDVQTGQEFLALKAPSGSPDAIAFSPNGQRIITCYGFGTKIAKVWDAQTGREIVTLKGHTARVNSAAFSPDGERIVTCSSNEFGLGEIKVWDASTGREVLEMKGMGESSDAYGAGSVAFSPDGRRIIACNNYGVHVWSSDPNDWKSAMRDTNHVNTHLTKAMTLLENDKYVPAVAEYKAALHLRPSLGTAKFLSNLGLHEYYAGQIAEAIKSSRSALGKDPALTDARMNLGLCYATQNDWPRAQREYDLAVKAAPKANLNSGIYYVQAAIKKHTNPALAKALVYLQKAGGK